MASDEQVDEVVLVGGASRMPMIGQLVTTLTGIAPRRGLIPDGVAIGAAIQAGVLRGDVRDALLLDAIPWPLCVRTGDKELTPIISRHTTVPTKRSEKFTTAEDNQHTVHIHVMQGDDLVTAVPLAMLTLTGLAPAPRGTPSIEVRLALDADSRLTITAVLAGTDREERVVVDGDTPQDHPYDPHARMVHVPEHARRVQQSAS